MAGVYKKKKATRHVKLETTTADEYVSLTRQELAQDSLIKIAKLADELVNSDRVRSVSKTNSPILSSRMECNQEEIMKIETIEKMEKNCMIEETIDRIEDIVVLEEKLNQIELNQLIDKEVHEVSNLNAQQISVICVNVDNETNESKDVVNENVIEVVNNITVESVAEVMEVIEPKMSVMEENYRAIARERLMDSLRPCYVNNVSEKDSDTIESQIDYNSLNSSAPVNLLNENTNLDVHVDFSNVNSFTNVSNNFTNDERDILEKLLQENTDTNEIGLGDQESVKESRKDSINSFSQNDTLSEASSVNSGRKSFVSETDNDVISKSNSYISKEVDIVQSVSSKQNAVIKIPAMKEYLPFRFKYSSESILLLKQLNKCSCGANLISGYFTSLPYCYFTGRLYCSKCHVGQVICIPSRVLTKLDCRSYKVCIAAFNFLSVYVREPNVNLRADIAHNLLNGNKWLMQLLALKKQLQFMSSYILSCKVAQSQLFQWFGSRSYFYSTSEYSLRDVVEALTSNLCDRTYSTVLKIARHIVSQCEYCQRHAYICEFCANKPGSTVIYPFQSKIVVVCKCNGVFHQKCYKPESCPRCIRNEKRNKSKS